MSLFKPKLVLDAISVWLKDHWNRLAEFAEVHDKAIFAAGPAVLALFTIVLAATVFLWRATRDLVRDAQDRGERQLRAYVSVLGGAIVHGTVDKRVGISNDKPRWGWSCGVYPGSNPGECTSGVAESFDLARAGFEAAWRDEQDWTERKYTMRKARGERMSFATAPMGQRRSVKVEQRESTQLSKITVHKVINHSDSRGRAGISCG